MVTKKTKLIVVLALPLCIKASLDGLKDGADREKSNLRPKTDSKIADLRDGIMLEDEDFWTRYLQDGFSFLPTPAPAPRPTFIPLVAAPTKLPTMTGGKCDLMVSNTVPF